MAAAPTAGKSAGESSAEWRSADVDTACAVRAADVRFADESEEIVGASAAACSAEEDSDGNNGCRSCIFVCALSRFSADFKSFFSVFNAIF